MGEKAKTRTAGEAGWRLSRYNMAAKIEGSGKIAVANLFRGTFGAYSPAELYLLDVLKTLPEDHPILDRFARRGLIVNFDELEALKAMRGAGCAAVRTVSLTICPAPPDVSTTVSARVCLTGTRRKNTFLLCTSA